MGQSGLVRVAPEGPLEARERILLALAAALAAGLVVSAVPQTMDVSVPAALLAAAAAVFLYGSLGLSYGALLVPTLILLGGAFGVLAGTLAARRLANGGLRKAFGSVIIALAFLLLFEVGA